ncbi:MULTISPECIES: hypothetical protein [unclassified Streptosporangium]|uniref:hypothetical protein n=1 Tax=unclassified Streptosporangium TaxID=2632669 RepID=UPI002E2B51A4|nr:MULTISPECIES: hypothetical protein [unclassified Streptosporangium]
MNILTRDAGVVLAGVVLAGAGLLVGLPAAGAHAASSSRAASAAPAAVCERTTEEGWICFLRYCDRYYCYYDCYPTLTARNKGDRPSDTVRIPKPKGTPPAQIERPGPE